MPLNVCSPRNVLEAPIDCSTNCAYSKFPVRGWPSERAQPLVCQTGTVLTESEQLYILDLRDVMAQRYSSQCYHLVVNVDLRANFINLQAREPPSEWPV